MNPVEFLQTVYLGDRLCRSIMIDGGRHEIRLCVDVISRVRGSVWGFNSTEDVFDGFIVLEGVSSFVFDPTGPIPNDWIECESVAPTGEDGDYRIVFNLGATRADSTHVSEVTLSVVAKSACIERADGVRLRN